MCNLYRYISKYVDEMLSVLPGYQVNVVSTIIHILKLGCILGRIHVSCCVSVIKMFIAVMDLALTVSFHI